MTLPDSAKPRNKRLSIYKFVIDTLADEAPVIVQGCSDLFGGWIDPRAIERLSSWLELVVDSFSGGLNSKMRVKFIVNVREAKDDQNFQSKRMDELLESVMSLLNLSGGAVIPIYDFTDPVNPVRIGEEEGLGFIPRHSPEKDGFLNDEDGVKRYELHYELWLWQEGVSS